MAPDAAGRYSTFTQFSIATNDYRAGKEYSEYHPVVTWDRLAEICGQFLAKGSLVSIEGRLQTRQWEDDAKLRHWKTEIVASSVEMLSGKRKKDYAAESAADALEAQASAMGFVPQDESENAIDSDAESIAEAEEDEEALVAA